MGAPAVTATASFVAGEFDGTVDLDPGPGVDMHESMITRGGSFVSKSTPPGNTSGDASCSARIRASSFGAGPWRRPTGASSSRGATAVRRSGPGPGSAATPNQTGAFVTRLDATGKLVWVRTLGGDGCDFAGMSGALDAGGLLWLSGATSGSCAFDKNGPASPALNGFFVASVMPDGTIRTFGSVMGGSQLADRPVVAHDGSIYLAGSVGPSDPGQHVPIDLDPSAGVSARSVPDTGLEFVMKLDHDGKLRWLQPVDVRVATLA